MAPREQGTFYDDVLNLLRIAPDGVGWEPLKDEIYSIERLEQHARLFASELCFAKGKRGRPLSPTLKRTHQDLLESYQALTHALRDKQPMSPAAEWYVDNFHVVEDQLRDIRMHLPPRYYQGLPKLVSGPLKGYPRVYAVALSLLAHTDCRLDATTLRRFVRAFQEVSPLSIGEIWAISMSLRLALIEYLTPLTVRIVLSRTNRFNADELADRLIKIASRPELHSGDRAINLIAELKKHLGRPETFDRAYIVQLIQRLRDQDSDVWPAYEWIEDQLKTQSTDTFLLTQLEHQRQAAAQVTVGNIISSMRLLSDLDWKDFFESVSLVDEALSRDPSQIFLKMDFLTRDTYRHVVERLARRSLLSEIQIAQACVELSLEAPEDPRKKHVGYFLVGEGMEKLEAKVIYRPSLRERARRLPRRYPSTFYLGLLSGLTLMIVAALVLKVVDEGAGVLVPVGWALLLLIPVCEMVQALLNKLFLRTLTPTQLPKMDLRAGVPDSARTMVVVPNLLSSGYVVKSLVEDLHVRYLGNCDENIFYGLLCDFVDADSEFEEHDVAILEAVRSEIAKLNQQHSRIGSCVFHLFVRRRKWSPSEGKWIGWERKRGKIEEFNRLLRGATDTSFDVVSADKALLSSIKYVITLDSDTQLPRDTARRMIGTIIHPLNTPEYDEGCGRVMKGYAILQPRISVGLSGSFRTRFSKIFSGHTGIDPYTTAVSDVYQDLFGEGSFTGKGLYDVDVFQRSLEGRVPEEALLSHDLFEGCFARCALVTDIELFDDYPADFGTFVRRLHRWTRGDWQISPWVLGKVSNASRKYVSNAFSLISRWKIADNLRRSLYAPSLLLALLTAWAVMPTSALFWTSVLLLVAALPLLVSVLQRALVFRKDIPFSGYLRNLFATAKDVSIQFVSTIIFLPDLACTQCDAIVRVAYRMNVSRKNILEWMSFSLDQSKSRSAESLWRRTGHGPIVGLMALVELVFIQPDGWTVILPLPMLWVLSASLKQWLAEPPCPKHQELDPLEIESFRNYARTTWNYFETFVTADENWLAPDNFQEDPKPVIAHRTSPTNIGLQLLSTCSAFDMGYLTAMELAERLEKTFATLARMERLHGHFYNWYNTLDLEPLQPRYLSTVDSGNLAAHLIAVKQYCLKLACQSTPFIKKREGTIDALRILHRESGRERTAAGVTVDARLEAVLEKTALALSELQEKREENFEIWSHGLRESEALLEETREILLSQEAIAGSNPMPNTKRWLDLAMQSLQSTDCENSSVASLKKKFSSLALVAERFFQEMDFAFLFDRERKIFVIGYSVAEDRRDNSFYDLLASESRLASFVAIAKGDVPQEHWFRLGRQLTRVKGGRALVSWSATMFEYLMPSLVTRAYEGTLLEETYHSIVARQREYGKQMRVPWGISEAGFNARDLNMNYQYGPFGIPGLGLKRGLSDELVVSPYSTMLAALVSPREALSNLHQLEELGILGRFGFYEAIDYTPDRIPAKQQQFVLKSFMAHHQGMSLVAINNVVNNFVVQNRFHADPLVQATELLLQERVPDEVTLSKPRAEELLSDLPTSFALPMTPRTFGAGDLSFTRTQILSNGSYSVCVSASGAGYSRCGTIAINRWREDATCDQWGQFIYIRDPAAGRAWTTGHHALSSFASRYEATFTEDKADFWREDQGIVTHTEIVVSPEDNAELRRVSLSNTSPHAVELEVTSFIELAISKQEGDLAHPAFSNLFVQTECVPGSNALLAIRRPRSIEAEELCAFHVLCVSGGISGPLEYETDRSQFLGRGNSAFSPAAIRSGERLSGSVGSVLDPSFSLRTKVKIKAGETIRLCFVTGFARSRDEALKLADKYHDEAIFEREAGLAWTNAQVQLRHLNLSAARAHVFQALAGRVIYSDAALRPISRVLSQNTQPQSRLWAQGIGGDLPIVLSSVSDEKDMALIRELLHAHEYLRLKGVVFDLVILNERPPSYFQTLQDEIQRQIRISGSKALTDKPGGIFVRRKELLMAEDVQLLKSIARVFLRADQGRLDEQLKRRPFDQIRKSILNGAPKTMRRLEGSVRIPELQYFNGTGGFSSDGQEYVIVLKEGIWTPAPWINVVANRREFGFSVSESGSTCTWSINSRENRLSPWSNDAVSDPPGEALFLRDESTGEYWTATPLPIRGSETYLVRHGRGYTRFECVGHGLSHELELFVPLDDSLKISRLKIKNLGRAPRKLSLSAYVEWVLGTDRSVSAPFVTTEVDPVTGAIFARNAFNNEFNGRVAFMDLVDGFGEFTCDRHEFLGPHGSLTRPAGMRAESLSQSVGAGLDPCTVLRHHFELQGGEERELVVLHGQAESAEVARALVTKYRDADEPNVAFRKVKTFWEETLGAVTVRTPDVAMNILMNGWLLYQTLACRLWARSAFYQSGGAYGFRDQLQDVMALVYSHPGLAREQILKASGRQFVEGDVQHWWHPPTGRGVRTRFSDDLLWLPYVTIFYVKTTGDTSVWDEQIPFITAPLLTEGQDDSYTQPDTLDEVASVWEHCARALDRSLKTGEHGLPLMGSGDWNDGMNQVGPKGRGESVWVAWFLSAILRDFAGVLEGRGQELRRGEYIKHSALLKEAIEKNAWDGDWYRRAYFDDGTTMGSHDNDECRIDSIAQSWSVLSGVGELERSRRAMAAVDEFLVSRRERLVKLFTPPFDRGTASPGYIKGYVPGVRENGGQYTHAAIWALMAFAELGEADKASEIYSLLNPINHTSTPDGVKKYKVEPYVVAADVYALSPHVGRGGWTWYTGSASWMYRAGLESILGLKVFGDHLVIKPSVPAGWATFEVFYRWKTSRYRITAKRAKESQSPIAVNVPLTDDGKEHLVSVLF